MNETNQLSFTGSVPANYDKYLGPMFFEPYARDVADLIDPSVVRNALEVCSGTGRVTRHLRQVLPSTTTLIASDLSPDMQAVAREKLKHLPIDWQIADVQALPFDDNSVDLVVCYFGYMLVPDKEKAFSEALRVLRKGGMLMMATWDKLENNEASHVFRKILKQYLGDTLPDSYKLPYSMHDPEAIVQVLKQSGFSKVESKRVEKQMEVESATVAAHGLVMGGSLYNEISKRDPGLANEIMVKVEKELAEKYGQAPMISRMSAIITRAWK
jgi:ubiquinone/menaquinone biosynthesis C-methylase UbiE